MNKAYKYIEMVEIGQKPKTKRYAVINRSSETRLGTIEWYGPWRQYCFLPEEGMVFSAGCLMDVIDFIKNLAGG